MVITVLLSASSSVLAASPSSSSSGIAAAPLPGSSVIFNTTSSVTGIEFQFWEIQAAGWSREALCGAFLADCALVVRIEQLAPAAGAECGVAVAVQASCSSKATPKDLIEMLCISDDPASPGQLLFPQDSPTVAWGTTVPPTVSGGLPTPVNPAYIVVSPSRLAALELIAIRNNRVATLDNDQSTELLQDEELDTRARQLRAATTLPLRLVVLSPQDFAPACGSSTVSYALSVEVVHNSACADVLIVPSQIVITLATNTTNETSIVIPGYNISTTVACTAQYGTCVAVAQDLLGGNSTITSHCACDVGYAPATETPGVDCLADQGLDLTPPAATARPIDPAAGMSPFDASSLWLAPNNRSLKGMVVEAIGVTVAPTTYWESFWPARIQVSKLVRDLSLVIHVTVHTPAAGFDQLMQVQFSTRFYPTLRVHTPKSCLNGSDLLLDGDVGATIGTGSCMSMTQAFPDVFSTEGSAHAFKLLIHPPMVGGLIDAAIAAGTAEADDDVPLFFTISFPQAVTVDVRAWFQDDLQMIVPQMQPSSLALPAATVTSPAPVTVSSLLGLPSASLPVFIPYSNQSWVQPLLENEAIFFRINTTGPMPHSELASLYVIINDTQCVSGLVTQGFFAPHWWHGVDGAQAFAQGMSTGLAKEIAPGTVPGTMALAGGCLRPTQRFNKPQTSQQQAGFYGRIFSTCEAFVELSVWHIAPVVLSMNLMGSYIPVVLNATGLDCWRELLLDINSSVQNDLLITVDQADAIIMLRREDLPTREHQYNSTQVVSVPSSDGRGGATWTRAKIAYADLNHGSRWYVAVAFGSSSTDAPLAPRAFRVQLAWSQDASFRHLSVTMLALLCTGAAIVAVLALIALKMRCDKWRREKNKVQTKDGSGRPAKKPRLSKFIRHQSQQESYVHL